MEVEKGEISRNHGPNSNPESNDSLESKKGLPDHHSAPVSIESAGPSSKSKSVLRMRYEAEVTVIRKKLGSLEEVRSQLGLSQRKMCQLLMVDPSAWTRWTRGGEDAPPHVYRMLQWYLALEDKYPALDANFWLSAVAKVRDPEETAILNRKTANLEQDQNRLRNEVGLLKTEARTRETASLQSNLDLMRTFEQRLRDSELLARNRLRQIVLLIVGLAVLAVSIVLLLVFLR